MPPTIPIFRPPSPSPSPWSFYCLLLRLPRHQQSRHFHLLRRPRAYLALAHPSKKESRTLPHPPRQQQPQQQRHISSYGYHQAKALIYSQPGSPSSVLSLHTHSIPPPHSTLITLRTLAAPLNPADINQIQGTYPSPPKPSTPTSSSKPTPPTPSLPGTVPGNEGCFEVLAVGAQVKTVKPGDWVIPRDSGLGTWRTHLQVDEGSILRINKEGLTPTQVAAVSVNPVTAYQLLKGFVDLRSKNNNTTTTTTPKNCVLLNGANSAVGRSILQLAHRWGIPTLAIIRSRNTPEETLSLKTTLKDLGATQVFTTEESQSPQTPPLPIPLALNCIGGPSATALSHLVSPGGVIVTYGAMSRQPMRVGASGLIFRDLTYRGFWLSRWAVENPGERERIVEEILGWMRGGEFDVGPTVEVEWRWGTGEGELVGGVGGVLEGYRKGKGMFVFGEM